MASFYSKRASKTLLRSYARRHDKDLVNGETWKTTEPSSSFEPSISKEAVPRIRYLATVR